MHTHRELIDGRALAAEIEDADLGIWHTAVEARLRVWLSIRACQFLLLLMPVLARSMCSVFAVSSLHRQVVDGGGVPCSCSSGNTSQDDEPL